MHLVLPIGRLFLGFINNSVTFPCYTACMTDPLKKPNPLENLVLVDVSNSTPMEAFEQWRDTAQLFHIEGCTRQVFMGFKDDLKTAPNLDRGDTKVYEGADAYARLLEYITGLLSRTRGESQIVSQFRNAQAEFNGKWPDKAVALKYVYDSIIQDNSRVRNTVTQNPKAEHSLKPAFFESAAHELSGQKSGDTVLIVLDAKPNGHPSNVTQNIIKQLGNHRAGHAEKIIFTHPDNEILKTVYSRFFKQKQEGKITSDIEMVPFQDLVNIDSQIASMTNADAPQTRPGLFGVDQAFVCCRMGQYPEADQQLIEAWRSKEAFGGTLLHLGGPNKADRHSIDIWRNANLCNYVSPEDISTEQRREQTINAGLVEKGKLACANCALCRSLGKQPVGDLSMEPEKMLPHTVLSVRVEAVLAKQPSLPAL